MSPNQNYILKSTIKMLMSEYVIKYRVQLKTLFYMSINSGTYVS